MQSLNIGSKPSCCNNSNATACDNAGSLACGNCLMITYCSKRCQVVHWATHRTDCRSAFMKGTWVPSWVTQNRAPTFLNDEKPPHTEFGTPKYFWGNVPAIDVVRLPQNEGIDFQEPLRVLFPASGDMRNAIFSVTSLPPGYKGIFNVVLNDLEFDIVARNVIFLLIFFVEGNPGVAAEHVLHIWYSALITESCHGILLKGLKPLIEQVCNKIAQKPGSALLGKTWKFGGSSLRLVLTRDNWFSLLSYFDVPRGLTKDTAQQLRQRVVSAPGRVDYVDRAMYTKSPTGKAAMTKFRDDGLLLPFGQPREEFTTPNPTMFHFGREWPMMDSADPTSAWSMKSFLEFDIGPAKNDVYGKLYHYLKHLFANFHRRLRSSPVAFTLLHVDAQRLPMSLTEKGFDRIDVGNISDEGYLGINMTLKTFAPLLQPVSINPHATLITLFLNAVPEIRIMLHVAPRLDPRLALCFFPLTEDPRAQISKVLRYMPELRSQSLITSEHSPDLVKIKSALALVCDMDGLFNFYMQECQFADVASSAMLDMKATNTIIDAWPMKFQGGRPTEQAKRDFALLLSSNHTGQERYMEWKFGAQGIVEDVD
ncbi:hypothetical protein F4823DRAFT_628512 [Ustulina deusta]|nr:hypothetical protein F4823DRAFT_628512 [Ustulina deusta]